MKNNKDLFKMIVAASEVMDEAFKDAEFISFNKSHVEKHKAKIECFNAINRRLAKLERKLENK